MGATAQEMMCVRLTSGLRPTLTLSARSLQPRATVRNDDDGSETRRVSDDNKNNDNTRLPPRNRGRTGCDVLGWLQAPSCLLRGCAPGATCGPHTTPDLSPRRFN